MVNGLIKYVNIIIEYSNKMIIDDLGKVKRNWDGMRIRMEDLYFKLLFKNKIERMVEGRMLGKIG